MFGFNCVAYSAGLAMLNVLMLKVSGFIACVGGAVAGAAETVVRP